MSRPGAAPRWAPGQGAGFLTRCIYTKSQPWRHALLGKTCARQRACSDGIVMFWRTGFSCRPFALSRNLRHCRSQILLSCLSVSLFACKLVGGRVWLAAARAAVSSLNAKLVSTYVLLYVVALSYLPLMLSCYQLLFYHTSLLYLLLMLSYSQLLIN